MRNYFEYAYALSNIGPPRVTTVSVSLERGGPEKICISLQRVYLEILHTSIVQRSVLVTFECALILIAESCVKHRWTVSRGAPEDISRTTSPVTLFHVRRKVGQIPVLLRLHIHLPMIHILAILILIDLVEVSQLTKRGEIQILLHGPNKPYVIIVTH